MNKKAFYLLGILVVIASGCKNISDRFTKTGEGMVTYDVSYPDNSKYGMKAIFFPKTITLVFKDDKAAFIANGGLGMVQLVNLMDYKTKKFTMLLIDNLRGNYGCALSAEEIKENESNPEYRFESTGEVKTIAGIECKKAIVMDMSGKSSFDVYYDNKIKFYYWNSPFKDFNRLFLEYTHTVNNLTMKLTAAKVDFTAPVDTSLFAIRGNYKWVDLKSFYSHLNEF